MSSRFPIVFIALATPVLVACVSMPPGPSVMVLPGSHQSFNQFRNDDVVCQQFASSQVGGTSANEAATNSGITGAMVGTAVGAAAGAALGGGRGAAIGAGSGLVLGSVVGAGNASGSMYDVQQRFDAAYVQCMYAKGHQVPVSGDFVQGKPYPEETPDNEEMQDPSIPPPPAGLPPPPPTE